MGKRNDMRIYCERCSKKLPQGQKHEVVRYRRMVSAGGWAPTRRGVRKELRGDDLVDYDAEFEDWFVDDPAPRPPVRYSDRIQCKQCKKESKKRPRLVKARAENLERVFYRLRSVGIHEISVEGLAERLKPVQRTAEERRQIAAAMAEEIAEARAEERRLDEAMAEESRRGC